MFLQRLQPEEVAKRWGLISGIIEKSIPPTANGSVDSLNNIMDRILLGAIQCWAVSDREVPVALLTTTITIDPGTGTTALSIYSLTSITEEPVRSEVWHGAISELKTYAKKMKCNHISAYTNIPVVVDLLRKVGADVSTTYAKFGL